MPKTTLDLGNEVRKACDDYWKKEISEQELKETLIIWKNRIFDDKEINITIQRIIGKKRIQLIKMLLEEHIHSNK